MLDALLQDIRYALRGFARSPGFTLAVVVTLALGIGANATILGVLDALLLRPPRYVKNPDEVVRVYIRGTSRWSGTFTTTTTSVRTYEALRAGVPGFASAAAFWDRELSLGRGAEARGQRAGGGAAQLTGSPPSSSVRYAISGRVRVLGAGSAKTWAANWARARTPRRMGAGTAGVEGPSQLAGASTRRRAVCRWWRASSAPSPYIATWHACPGPRPAARPRQRARCSVGPRSSRGSLARPGRRRRSRRARALRASGKAPSPSTPTSAPPYSPPICSRWHGSAWPERPNRRNHRHGPPLAARGGARAGG